MLPIVGLPGAEGQQQAADAWDGRGRSSTPESGELIRAQRAVYSVTEPTDRYVALTGKRLMSVPQLVERTTPEVRRQMYAVSRVLPSRNNEHVVNSLIDWDDPNDPFFRLTFPQPDMLHPEDMRRLLDAMDGVDAAPARGALKRAAEAELNRIALEIRGSMNPHPAGQRELNVPWYQGRPLTGVQHKYSPVVLVFCAHSETCHSICQYCFRAGGLRPGDPQYEMLPDGEISTRDMASVVGYLREHAEATNVLLTGGDPLIMGAWRLRQYVEPLLDIDSVDVVRIGSKALSYWPQRFVTDQDAAETLELFEQVVTSGRLMAIQAHYGHPKELEPQIAREAFERVRATGAVIRSQAPVVRGINDDPAIWAELWKRLVRMGAVPYYMFIARDTGPQDYFAVPISRALEIYKGAMNEVGGLCKPQLVGSWTPGKVEVVGTLKEAGRKCFVLRFVQARNPDWNREPFLAEFDEEAIWFDQLRPPGGGPFFFEEELQDMISQENARRRVYEDALAAGDVRA